MTAGDDTDRFRDIEPQTPPAPPPPATPPRSSGARWVAGVLGAVALVAGLWIVTTRLPGWLTAPESGTTSTSTSVTTGGTVEPRRIQATLFYVSHDGTTLVPTNRDVLYGATPAEQARRLVEAQVDAPPEGLVSAIPPGTTVRAVFMTDAREAYVDLGGTIVTGHSGGSLDETLTVYAIVNAITANLPDVRAVQILVEGQEVDSLRGHVDLRAPLTRGTDWIQKGPSPP